MSMKTTCNPSLILYIYIYFFSRESMTIILYLYFIEISPGKILGSGKTNPCLYVLEICLTREGSWVHFQGRSEGGPADSWWTTET